VAFFGLTYRIQLPSIGADATQVRKFGFAKVRPGSNPFELHCQSARTADLHRHAAARAVVAVEPRWALQLTIIMPSPYRRFGGLVEPQEVASDRLPALSDEAVGAVLAIMMAET
jgi:tRNA A37 threonylcarbamoyladenosine synthetase subunit TsaC/SUA5/YrdC